MKPDFYILGAPKCGTTALDDYLRRHVEIHMLPKELHFHGSDLSYQNPRLSKKEYQNHLAAAPKGAVIGEGAVWYLTSHKAAQEIQCFSPKAKLIVMLRNPVDAMYSLHNQMVYTGNEPETDFEKALKLESDRAFGRMIPGHYYCPIQGLFYREVYNYAHQIKRYLNTFPTKNLHFVLFDDFKQDPKKMYREVLEFVGVDPDFAIDFDIINASQVTRSKGVQNMLLTPPKGIKSLVKTVLPSKKVREKLKAMAWQRNSKTQKRVPMPEALRQQLTFEFKEGVERLEDLIQVDLSAWKSV